MKFLATPLVCTSTGLRQTLVRRRGAVGDGLVDDVGPGAHVVHRATDEFVHLGRLSALTDEVDAAAARRLLADYQLRQRYHARLPASHTHTRT